MANEFKIKKGLIVTGASGGTVVDIQGSQGQLFSVTDDLSGSIFAVSDISGVPILDINSSGISYFDGTVGIGTSSPGKKLEVKSDITYDGIQISGSSIPTLAIIDTTNNAKLVAYARDSDATIGTETNHTLTINTNNTTALTLDTSQNATFAGNVSGVAGTFTGNLAVGNTSAAEIYLNRNSANYINASNAAGYLVFRTGGTTTALTLNATGAGTFGTQAFATTATSSGDGSSTLTTKGYVDSLITGATIYRGAWDPSGGGYGSPDLSGVTQTSGYYYICSAAGTAEPNGTGCEPDSWETGDWVIWNDDIVDCAGTGTGGWQKIDNSSVLSGVGTGQTVALWEGAGSVTDSETLGNAPITVSGNNTTFAGEVNAGTGLRMYTDGSGNGVIYNLGQDKDLYFVGDDGGTGINALVFDMSEGGNATFAGDVTAADLLTVNGDGHLFLGADGETPKIDMMYDDHASGLGWDTRIFIGKTDDLPNAQSFPTSTIAGGFGTQYQANSDGAFFGIIPYNTGNYRPVINWGDDATDSPFSFQFNGTNVVNIDVSGNVGGNSFTGDHRGTINTATTGVTQTAGDNSTKIATTAYADAAAAAVPIGNYLPLSAGSSYPLTGDLYIEGADKALRINNGTQPVVYLGDGGANTDGQLLLYNSTGGVNVVFNGDNQNHYITNGNVGIGTTSPTAAKLVVDSDTAPQVLVKNTAGGNAKILFEDNSGVTQNASITFDQSAQNTLTIATGYQSSTDLNRINIAPAGDVGLTVRGGTGSNSGNVGIGTTSPDSILEIVGDDPILTIRDSSTGLSAANATLRLAESGSSNTLDNYWDLKMKPELVGGTTNFAIANNSLGEVLNINYQGNVGIGTTTPNAKLDVQGTQGQLFSVTDDLSGDIFSVADISGVPIMNVNSDGTSYFDGNVGIGTNTPATSAKLTVMGNQTFGIPGNGSNTDGRFISIEGNADSAGEGSGRIFFTEHNSTTQSMDAYGMSIGYRGGATSIVGASGETWDGLSQIGNGQWGMWGHNGSNAGSLIMSGDRSATYVDFAGNNIQGITDAYIADQIIHTGDTNTYMQFHAADQWRVVTGGVERLEVNNSAVTVNGCPLIVNDYVGIGTATPVANLEVSGATAVLRVGPRYTSGGDRDFIDLIAHGSDTKILSNNERFHIENNSGNIIINPSGNVGIGTTSPSDTLEVEGGVTITSETPTKLLLNNTKNGSWTQGEALGLVEFYGNDASGGGAKVQSSIEVVSQDQYGAHFNMTFNLSKGSGGNAELMRLTGEGRLGIGTAGPLATLHVDNNQTSNGTIGIMSDAAAGGTGTRNIHINLPEYGEGIRFLRSGTYSGGAMKFYSGSSNVGSVQINASSTSFNTTSDYRAKENVVPMENSINRLKELKPCRFNFLIDPENTVDGFIAHEAQEVVPEAITGEKDELDYEGNPRYQGIDQSKLVPLLTSALQEAISKIEQLETRIQTLENN